MRKYYLSAAVLMTALCLAACSGGGNVQEPAVTSDAVIGSTSTQESTSYDESTMASSASEEQDALDGGYLFEAKAGLTIAMHQEAEPVLSQLSEPSFFLESPSCAFQGTDRIYNYQSYQITTYEKEGKEYIYDVYFLDDSVTTAEGIYIGCSLDEVISAYGENYTEDNGKYTFEKDAMQLIFLMDNDTVQTIEYSGIVN